MGMTGRSRTGGQILVDQMLLHGSTIGFCVPGESYLAVLDALHDVRRPLPPDQCPPRGRRVA
jgi:acetolactate synthase-1/2/3 large subunit